MTPAATMSFLPLLTIGLIAAFSILIFLRRKKAAQIAIDGPMCGQCGYGVRGIGSLNCPECGADLREAGIVTGLPQHEVMRTLPIKLIQATAFVVVVAAVMTPLVLKYCLPTQYTAFEHFTLLGPQSGRYNRVEFHSHGSSMDWPYQKPNRSSLILEWVDVTLTLNDGRTIELRAGIDGRGYQYTKTDGSLVAEADPLDEKAVMAWMTDGGIDTNGDAVRNEAINIAIVVSNADHGAMASPTSVTPAFAGRMRGQSATFRGAPKVAKPLAVFFWVAVWLLMLSVVMRRHDRATARYFAKA